MSTSDWNIIGESEKLHEVLDTVKRVADTDIIVLIQGESGTGKEMVARAIHEQSTRSSQRMVSVNCGAIPEGILESELFGHEKGAFTGAISQRQGYFELAHKGTIFLDEIGEMSLQMQVKLLRVLESGEFLRVGGGKVIKSDARVVAATNKNLDAEVRKGNFRQDLFYRLKAVTVNLPSLRERKEDIALLVEKFIRDVEDKYHLRHEGFSPEVIYTVNNYEWPGNVRELKNFIESVVLLKKGKKVEMEDLPDNMRENSSYSSGLPVHLNKSPDQAERELIYGALLGLKAEMSELKSMMSETVNILKGHQSTPDYGMPLGDITEYVSYDKSNEEDISVEKIESDAIREALKRYSGNRRLAAGALGISERTLYRKLKKI